MAVNQNANKPVNPESQDLSSQESDPHNLGDWRSIGESYDPQLSDDYRELFGRNPPSPLDD